MNLSAISLAINRPSQAGLPALNLDFAGTRSVDPRITFTRASTATRFNSSGVLETVAVNTPRIDFDPVTGACRGLLIEEQRTNLLTRSQEFDNASWTKTGATVTANAVIAPDGTLTGEKIVEDTATSSHNVLQVATGLTAGTFTASIYAKAGERQYLQLGEMASTGIRATFDLQAGTVAAQAGSVTPSIQAVGNGWYRCIITVTISGTAFGFTAAVSSTATTAVPGPSYAGDGYSGIYIWGAQLEAGAFPTSYIPTTSSQVTRSADRAVMTGTNFSSWYRQDEGTLYAEWLAQDAGTTFRRIVSLFEGSTFQMGLGNGTGHGYTDTGFFSGNVSGTTQFDCYSLVSPPAGTFRKTAGAYAANNFAVSTNGSPISGVAQDNSGAVPLVDTAVVGGSLRSGYIRRIAYWPARLPNNQLQAITA